MTYVWRTFFILWLAGLVGVAAVMPYSFSLQSDFIATAPLLVLLSLMQAAVLLAGFVYIGLRLAPRTGLKTPVLDAFLAGSVPAYSTKHIRIALLSGALVAVLILGFEMLFRSIIPALTTLATPPLWQGLLAAFYGGITEEILLRLGIMTLLAWTLMSFTPLQPSRSISIAIIIAALLFGALHLPAMAAVVDLTPLIVLRVLLLNSLGGIVFGYLYWKHGLEYAMLAHFTTDLLLQTGAHLL